MILDSVMENANETSPSLSFISLYPSCWSTNQTTSTEICSDTDNLSLRRRSSNLEKPFLDAEIVVEGKSVAVNRSILSARSPFFHELFNLSSDGSVSEGKPKYLMTDLVPYGEVGYEAFNDILHCLYTGKLKASPPEVATCVDEACAHDACPPAINFAIELTYASAAFQMTELASVFQRRLLNFVEKALVEDVIPILVAAFHCQLSQLRSHCVQRVVRSNLDDVCLEKALPDEVSREIKSLRFKSNEETESNIAEVDPVHAKRVRRIHKALDNDDVELLKLLLEEYNVTLDDAYTLHYAAAYCNPKVFKEVLNMGLADLNLKDARGRTVLYVAARRKEPAVLVALLCKGACTSETTSDGQTALAICRRMTRRKDYIEATKQGQETNKDWLCIDVLEREMRMNFMSGSLAMSSEVIDDDFQTKLNYLENRVAFARCFFPSEAILAMDKALLKKKKKAMDKAGADTTNFDAGLSLLPLKPKVVDLNETPSMQPEGRQFRLQTLLKTVETGRRYFPHCSEVVDKFFYCDWSDAILPESDALEEQKLRRARFMELKEEMQKAFFKDMAYDHRSGLPLSMSAFYKCKAGNNLSGMPTSSASSN